MMIVTPDEEGKTTLSEFGIENEETQVRRVAGERRGSILMQSPALGWLSYESHIRVNFFYLSTSLAT